MKRRISTRTARINLAVFLSLSATGSLMAADSTWSLTPTDGSWANSANWDGGVIPGNNAGAAGTSTDLAYFTDLPAQRTIGIDAFRNIRTIQFGTIAMADGVTSAYTIGADGQNAGNTLYLSNGGAIHMLSSVVATGSANESKVVTLNAPMHLTGTSYSFINDAGSVTDTRFGMNIFGTITAGAGAPTTITFGATAGTSASSRNENQATISDGAGGAVVSVIKNGPGSWEFNQSDTNANTYSGDTILNEGTLRSSTAGAFNGLGGFSRNSHYIINSGAVLRNSVSGSFVKAVTINPGGSLSMSNGNASTLSFTATSGPALHFNFAGQSTFSLNAPLVLTGTTANEGGIKLTANDSTGSVSMTSNSGGIIGNLELGTVKRVFDIAKGNAANQFDLRVSSIVIGGGAGAGITKTGAGTLRFESPFNSWTGQLEIREGDVRGGVDNVFNGLPDLLISGGNLHVFGTAGTSIQTFGPMTATKGSITAGSTIASTVRAPSFTLNVGTGDTFSAAAILADSSGPAALIKSGAGAATLTGANTYTGGTTVNGGILGVNTNSEDIIINPGTPGANITTGRIVFDYTGGTSPASTIVPVLDAGYDVNFATGQLRSSTANSGLGLGYRDNGTDAFTVAYTRYGDANLDLKADINDFALLAANFNTAGGWDKGNFNYDAVVNISDFALLAANFNLTAPAAGDLPRAAVPEPVGAVALVAAAGLLSRNRRR